MTESYCGLRLGTTADVIAQPLVSICIPTYNRRERVMRLVQDILSVDGPLEVCVHVDGSNDGTTDALTSLTDVRLTISTGDNQGKTAALLNTIRRARGNYIMSFDDDDDIDRQCLQATIQRCSEDLPHGVGGFIYHMRDERGSRVGSSFPGRRSNFIKLRAEDGVKGDKKEIVLADLAKRVSFDPKGAYRRAPPSLTWARIALTHDVICFDEYMGVKRYLAGGITSKIWRTKLANAYPMHLLYRAHCAAFLRGRYRSITHFLRALTGVIGYGLIALTEIGRR